MIAAKVMAWAPFGHAVAIQKSSTAPIQRWARSWCASRQRYPLRLSAVGLRGSRFQKMIGSGLKQRALPLLERAFERDPGYSCHHWGRRYTEMSVPTATLRYF